METPIEGWAVYISNHRHQYSPIDIMVNQLIDLSMDRQKGKKEKSVGKHTEVRINQPIYKYRRGDTYQRRQIDG